MANRAIILMMLGDTDQTIGEMQRPLEILRLFRISHSQLDHANGVAHIGYMGIPTNREPEDYEHSRLGV